MAAVHNSHNPNVTSYMYDSFFPFTATFSPFCAQHICNVDYVLRGDIHTQFATLNVNMTLKSETLTPPPLTSSVATDIPSFRRKTKKSYF